MTRSQWYSVLGTVANTALAICAVVVTVLVVRREFFPAVAAAPQRTLVADWRAYATDGHRLGPDAAATSIVVFSDFQCPACRTLAAHLKVIREEFPAVAIIHRHAPLPNHPFAVAAARASDCAGEQGRFEPFHDVLFAHQPSIGLTPWSRFAAMAAVPDSAAFERCVSAPTGGGPLATDTIAARKLAVQGTPTFMINGLRFTGTPPLDTLRAYTHRAETSGSPAGR